MPRHDERIEYDELDDIDPFIDAYENPLPAGGCLAVLLLWGVALPAVTIAAAVTSTCATGVAIAIAVVAATAAGFALKID